MISNLTLEERERMAYIAGDTKTAAILGEMMEYQADVDDEELERAREDAFDDGDAHGYDNGYEEGVGKGREDAAALCRKVAQRHFENGEIAYHSVVLAVSAMIEMGVEA